MKIAFLSPAAGLGGAERCLLDLMVSLRRAAPEISLVLVAGTPGPLLESARDAGAEVQILPMPSRLVRAGDSAFSGKAAGRFAAAVRLPGAAWAGLGHARDLSRLLSRLAPTVVHSNGMKHHVLASLARRGGVPVVWHVRDLVGARPVMARALRLLRTRVAGVLAISEAVREDVLAALPGVPCERVYDGIDLEAFHPAPEDPGLLDALARVPAAPTAVLRVGLVATFARWKGQDLFIEAVARLAPELRRRARFYVVGGPIYDTAGSQFGEAELRRLAAEAGIAEYVAFVPFQPDPARVFRALDVAVHASTRREPFGRTIAEAMACGIPVIASRGAGATELLDGRQCIQFETKDAASLAAALGTVLESRPLRERLAREGRALAVARFSRERLGPEVLVAYRKMGIRA